MSIFDICAVLVTLAAAFSFINYRLFKLPTTIGVMLIALLFSLGIIALGQFDPGLTAKAKSFVAGIDFEEALLDVMLSYLLFAGALHVDLKDLKKQKFIITLMATMGTILSTFLVGTAFYLILGPLGVEGVEFIHCLLFGALISPTDPVAVLGILKTTGAPKTLETKITGESLFNDGVGVVVFLTVLGIITGRSDGEPMSVIQTFGIEVGGGLLLGVALGAVGYYMLKKVDQYQVEILITLAIATGGYSLAHSIHVSGPLAMVVAGLMVGNPGRKFAMSPKTEEHLDTFWELIDEILNALLFLLIGIEILILDLESTFLIGGLIAIVVVLLARYIAVLIPVSILKTIRTFSPRVVEILTWGGLRGGISVALALAIPSDMVGRDFFLTATYMVVIFSIAVQGLTLGKFIRKCLGTDSLGGPAEEADAPAGGK